MSKEKFVGGCKIHGPGHTTLNCPELGGIFSKVANDEYKKTTDEDFEEWRVAINKICGEFNKLIFDFSNLKTNSSRIVFLSYLDKIIELGEKISTSCYGFISKGSNLKQEQTSFVEDVLLEVEKILFKAIQTKDKILNP